MTLDLEAAGEVQLRHEAEIREGERVAHRVTPRRLAGELLEGREPARHPVARPGRRVAVQLLLHPVLHRRVLQRLNARGDQQCELARASAEVSIRGEERGLGVQLLEQLEDGERLGDAALAAVDRGSRTGTWPIGFFSRNAGWCCSPRLSWTGTYS